MDILSTIWVKPNGCGAFYIRCDENGGDIPSHPATLSDIRNWVDGIAEVCVWKESASTPDERSELNYRITDLERELKLVRDIQAGDEPYQRQLWESAKKHGVRDESHMLLADVVTLVEKLESEIENLRSKGGGWR